MADFTPIRVSELPEVTNVGENDYLVVDDGTQTSKIKSKNYNERSSGSAKEYADEAARSASLSTERAEAAAQSVIQVDALAQNASASANNALDYSRDAEAWAKGTRDGSAVPITDATHENNAKYFAQQAQNSATSAAESADAAEELLVSAIDPTLTRTGKAADAKKTGDELTALKSALTAATNFIDMIWEQGSINASTGDIFASSARIRTVDYVNTSIETLAVSDGYENALCAWDDNDAYMGQWNRTEKRWIKGLLFGNGDIDFKDILATYPNYKYKIILKRSNNTDIQTAEATNLTYSPVSDVAINKKNIERLSDDLAADEELIDSGAKNISVQGGFVLGNTGNGALIVSSSNNMITPTLQEIKTNSTLTTDWSKYKIYQWELKDRAWIAHGWKTSDISLETGYVGRFVVRGLPIHDFTEEEQAEINAVTVYVVETTLKKRVDELEEKSQTLPSIGKSDFISICHQGYSDTMAINQSLLPGFALAAEHGFEYAETDVVLSSNNIVMCCHDSSFVDATTGETIVIGEHTDSELKTYNYYGGTIATLDEVMAACKENRIGLVIDHATNAILPYVFPVVRKYGMQDNVIYLIGWAVGNPNYANNMYNSITTFYKRSRVMFMAGTSSLSEVKEFISVLDTKYSKVDVTINHSLYSIADIIALSQELPGEVTIAVWTIDNLATAKQYMPYVTAITSNKFSSADIFD